MSGTTEWRKLADFGIACRSQAAIDHQAALRDALRAACDRLDEQANLLGIANEKWGEATARAEAAEALATDTQRDLNECSKRLVAAEARCKELDADVRWWRDAHREMYKACCDEQERAEKAEARLKVAAEALSAWLAAYDATGPDNGPSLTEHECAKQARNALAKLKGEP